MKTVEILLSLYGKSEFLGEFLQSLYLQYEQNFRLLYRFDGDADPRGKKMLQEFPRSMELSNREHLGVTRSYQALLNASDADYLMFADQDDIWHPDKVSVSVAVMEQLEAQFGKNHPILVHTDLHVIDAFGQLLNPSLWRFQALSPRKNGLKDLMIQNNVTGCTVILNRALVKLLGTFPEETICHDWYLAMIAAAFGTIKWLDQATIDYRQHRDNVFGAVPRRRFLPELFKRRQLHERIVLTQAQARAFLTQYRDKLTSEQVKLLSIWGNDLTQMGYLKRLITVCRHQYRKNDLVRTLGMWWAL